MSEKDNLIPNEGEDINEEAAQPEAKAEGKSKKIEYDESLFENSTIFGAAAHQKKKHRLTPTAKGFILSAVALLVAGAVLTTVLLIPKKDNTAGTTSTPSTPTYTVTSIKEADIDTVQVYNDKHPEGFKLVKQKNAVPSTSSDASSGSDVTYTWQVEGFEKYDLTGTKYLIQSAVALSSTKKYAKSASVLTADDISLDDLSFAEDAPVNDKDLYGFLTPFSVLAIKGAKVEKNIIVGNATPDKSGRYVTVTGDSNVYVISESSMAYFDGSYTDMVGMLVNDFIVENEGTADYYTDGALAKIDKVVLGGSCRKDKVRIESPPDDLAVLPFVVTEPVFRAGDEESISTIMDVATTGLVNEGAYQLGHTKADLAKFGLDKPVSTLEIIVGSYRVALSFGKLQEDGYYPCLKEGSDIIYRVTAEGHEWITYTDKDLYYDTLFLEYISDIDSINVKVGGKDVTFNLVREDPKEKSKYTIKCDQAKKGVTIDAKQINYYYGRILSLATEEFSDKPAPTGDGYMTITFDYTDKSRKNDVIRLYEHSTRRYFYTLNGQGNSLIAKNYVDDLAACLDKLLKGEEIGRG